ncbi:hypothetical protein [Micromonospora sp. NPDC005652]|uniref:hypothetical protein n=1 Tax=Micromonospora sp. NPDC005652 TaxID=3157046 RepID=UPI0033F2CAFF
MSHYVVKLYGLVCDVCGYEEEHVPLIDDARKLAATRAYFAERGWKHVNGKDVCATRDADHEEARIAAPGKGWLAP